MELLLGLEPRTSSLPRKCSTTELQQRDARHARVVSSVGRGTRGAPVRITQRGSRGARGGERGAGEGNRTLVCSLEGCRSTIELRPPERDLDCAGSPHGSGARCSRTRARTTDTPARSSGSARPSTRARTGSRVASVGRSWSQRASAWCGVGLDGERSRTPARRGPDRCVASRRSAKADASESGWWGETDSNRRRLSHQIYSLTPLAARESPRCARAMNRCERRRRADRASLATHVAAGSRSLNHPRTGLVVMERVAQRARRCGGRRPGDGPARLRVEPAVGFEPTTT
jgi:hypothetical protein